MKKLWSLALLLVAVFALSACGSKAKSINCEEFIKVTYVGFEKSASVQFAYNEKFASDREMLDKMFPDLKRTEAKEVLEELFSELEITADKTKELSNGDEITIEVAAEDSEVLEEYELKLTNTKFTVKVKGLEEGIMVDPFENLQITFSGYDTVGSFSYDDSRVDHVLLNAGTFGFDWDLRNKLSNGDKFTVKYEVTDNEKLLEAKYAVTVAEKEYTVSGLEALQEINPFDYIEVTYSGYDGDARIIINKKEDYPSVLRLSYFEASKEDQISIGDMIKITYDMDAIDFAKRGFKITETEKTYTAKEGIKEYNEIDAFPEGLIVAKGMSPMAELSIDRSVLPEEYRFGISYEVEGTHYSSGNTYYVAVGEKVVIKVSNPDALSSRGYKAKEESKTYTFDELFSYFDEDDDVTSALDMVAKEAEEILNDTYLSKYKYEWADELQAFDRLTLVSCTMYRLTEDNLSYVSLTGSTTYNLFYVVYKVEGTWKKNENDHYIGIWAKGISYGDDTVECLKLENVIGKDADQLSVPWSISLNRYEEVDVVLSEIPEETSQDEQTTQEEVTDETTTEDGEEAEMTEDAQEE